MERSLITFFLLCCLTLGFIALFGAYLPDRLASEKQEASLPPVTEDAAAFLRRLERAPLASRAPHPSAPLPERAVSEPPPVLVPTVTLDAAQEAEKIPLEPHFALPKAPLYIGGYYFKIPYSIREMVEFWRNIFARYTQTQSVLHDAQHLDIVYGILRFDSLYDRVDVAPEEKRRVRNIIEETHKAKLASMLTGFHDGKAPQSAWEEIFYDRFSQIGDPVKFKTAAENLRAQRGQKDRFEEGLIRLGRYQGELEKIFREEGVPVEITRLTLVESMFNVEAVSKVGAAGPWQFMPETGKQFMTVGPFIDARRDPLIAGRGAAQLLMKNYEKVKSWPLAINAYNTGAGRILRAIQRLQTRNIAMIIRYFEDPAYQFASRNFYPEFLAALETAQNYRNYFGELPFDRPVPYDTLALPHHTSLHKLALATGTGVEIFRDLNPSLTPAALSPNTILPGGLSLRFPRGQKALYLATVEMLHEQEKDSLWHVVAPADSLKRLANTYKISMEAIRFANDLPDNRLREGQVLKIPGQKTEGVLTE